MTEREALKLALETLERYAIAYVDGDEAITAIREVLAQPDKKWVGLTKEEVEDIEITWEATSELSTFGHAVRYIEAVLEEKNK